MRCLTKNEYFLHLTTKLCNLFFINYCIPSDWHTYIIKPIPKSSKIDPLQYSAILLLPCLNKLCSCILNDRLSTCLEANVIYVDEQNGFRKRRSCEEHTFLRNTFLDK